MSSKGPLSAETWACLQNQIAFLHEILQPSKFHFGDASSCASSPLPLLSAFTSVFLPLQDIGSPHASVGSPLEGQKVKLSAFFSHSCPLCASQLPFSPVCLSGLSRVYQKDSDQDQFACIPEAQHYCHIIFLVNSQQTGILLLS